MFLVWDQHACLPLSVDADFDELSRYEQAAGGFISLNVGYAPHSWALVTELIAAFRGRVDEQEALTFARTVADVDAAVEERRFAIAFDLEDSGPLEGRLDRLDELARNGVRTLGPSYNHRNQAGCGCLDADDTGLTPWGGDLVREMNAVGIVPDGSHCSSRTGIDMCRVSTAPVVYSHSCMQGVWQHPRNITDDQARACADTGGVVGITGVGIFLGRNTPTLDAMTRHLEYVIDLVGIDHAGVSSDYSFDHVDFRDEIAASPELFDESYTRYGPIEWMPPETFVGLSAHLLDRGWSIADVRAVLGGNFRRVASATWPTVES